MSAPRIVAAIQATLHYDRAARDAGETELMQLCGQEGFPVTLLGLITSDADISIRQGAAIYMKNLVAHHWVEDRFTKWLLHESDKQFMRGNIIEAIISSPEIIRSQLCLTLKRSIDAEFPAKWAGVDQKLLKYVSSGDYSEVMGGLEALYMFVKKFEFVSPDERGAMDALIAGLLPTLYRIALSSLENPTPDSLLLVKMTLKIFYSTISFNLPAVLMNGEFWDSWMSVLGTVLRLVVTAPEDDDKETWPERPVWKCKKWAGHIIYKLFERYGNISYGEETQKAFAQHFLDNWAVTLLQIVMEQLSQYAQGQYVSPRVLQRSLEYVENAVNHGRTWKVMKDHTQELVSTVIFPLLCHTDEDDVLWESDPYEYVRLKFDTMQEFKDPIVAAENLLLNLVQKRKKLVFDNIMVFCFSLLQKDSAALATNPATRNPREKDGVLHMIGDLFGEIRKKAKYRDMLESMIVSYVFPEFESTVGFLRARAAHTLRFCASGPFHDERTIHTAVNYILQGLVDGELPVRIESAAALFYWLDEQEIARELVRTQLKGVIEVLLQLLRESENDGLTDVMSKMIEIYGADLVPFASELVQQLAASFTSLLDYDPDSETEQHKAMAAAGCLDGIRLIADVFAKGGIHDGQEAMEEALLPVFNIVFDQGLLDFMEDAIDLTTACTQHAISPRMWTVLAMMHKAFKRDCIDYFQEMLKPLHHFVQYGADVLITSPDAMNILFDMVKSVWEMIEDEEALWHAAKLMELIMSYCSHGQIDDYVSAFVGFAVTRLLQEVEKPIDHSYLRVMCLNVVIHAMYLKPRDVIKALEDVITPDGQPLTAKFFALWFSNLPEFRGIHNRKLSILCLLHLLEQPVEELPVAVQQSWPHILPALMQLFDGLAKAYDMASRAAEYEEEEEEDGEYEEDEEEDGVYEEDDEDAYSEGAEEAHLEEISKDLGEFLGSMASEFEEIDSDEIDEGWFGAYSTQLDKAVSEFAVFKQVMDSLSATSEGPSAALFFQQSTPEMQEQIQHVLLEAHKREELERSKEIQQQGGFQFQIGAGVPKSFNFGAK